MNSIFALIDANKIGGYVRAATAGLLADLITHVPVLHDVLSADACNAIAVAAATVVVGVWSHIAKSAKGN